MTSEATNPAADPASATPCAGASAEAVAVLVAELEGVIFSLARELDAVRQRLAEAEARAAGEPAAAPQAGATP